MQVHFDKQTHFEHFEGDNDLVEDDFDSNGSPKVNGTIGQDPFYEN